MSVTITRLFPPTFAGTAATVIYTVPSDAAALTVGAIRCTNVTNAKRKFTAYAVPAAGSPAPQNAFAFEVDISAGEALDTTMPVLGPGDSLRVVADAVNAITVSSMAGLLIYEDV